MKTKKKKLSLTLLLASAIVFLTTITKMPSEVAVAQDGTYCDTPGLLSPWCIASPPNWNCGLLTTYTKCVKPEKD